MPYELSSGFGLGAFIRLKQASPSELQSALRVLLGQADLRCRTGTGILPAPAATLSALSCNTGIALCLAVQQRVRLEGWSLPQPVWLHPVSGSFALLGTSGDRLLDTRADACTRTILVSGMPTLDLATGSRVLLMVPATTTVPVYPDMSPGDRPIVLPGPVARRIDAYLFRITFCQDYNQARELTRSLFSDLNAGLSGDEPVPVVSPSLDRRLQRAIEKMQQEPEWAFDLSQLARHAGASERNLYYLMKRETGLTPYRYYQRCRLLRVRSRLVDCRCEEPHISWYAADEGFSHLGRFAALYRQHFGELPSETVQWRRLLQESVHTRDSLAVS